jgi:hypothetical protein
MSLEDRRRIAALGREQSRRSGVSYTEVNPPEEDDEPVEPSMDALPETPPPVEPEAPAETEAETPAEPEEGAP